MLYLILVASPAIITGAWLLGNKSQISFQEPLGMILIGVIFIGLANIGQKKFKKS
jgi:hypothetical protein